METDSENKALRELNIGDFIYYVDKESCTIKREVVIKKTIIITNKLGIERREITYTIKYGATTIDFEDHIDCLKSSSYIYRAFKTKEALLKQLETSGYGL